MTNFSPPPGLKFCCDYMTSFSPGWNLKLRNIRGKVRAILFLWKPNHWACPSSLFSPGWNLKLRNIRGKVKDRHLVSLKTQSLSMSKLTFQPGLEFECAYMRFFWISARAEIFSPVSQTELEISPWKSLHVIAHVFLRRFVQYKLIYGPYP